MKVLHFCWLSTWVAVLLLCVPPPSEAEDAAISLSDAIVKTLSSNPGVRIEKVRVEKRAGLLRQAMGEFDWYGFASASWEEVETPVPDREQRNARNELTIRNTQIALNNRVGAFFAPPVSFPFMTGEILTETEETKIGYSLGVTHKFRNGISVTPSATVVDYQNNADVPEPEASSEVSMEVVIPLLRGLGGASSARERAARSGLDAVQQFSRHNIAGQVRQTTKAFWNNLAAYKAQDAFEETESRSKDIHRLIKDLIAVGELEPPAIYKARARMNRTRTDSQQALLALYESRVALALAMGMGSDEMTAAPLAQGSFPTVAAVDLAHRDLREHYVSEALVRRGDLAAARMNIETESILLGRASDARKPRLDLTLRAGYRGIDASQGGNRYLDSLYTETAGPNFFAGIRGELPLYNDAAIGETVYREGLVKEAELNVEQLANRIAGEVLVAMERVGRILTRYQLAVKTESEYRQAADHENFKLREGESSLSALIDVEEDYQDARVARIRAHRDYANALTGLHFAVGTLLEEGDDHARVNTKRLATVPLP